jgi:hypothetical protein
MPLIAAAPLIAAGAGVVGAVVSSNAQKSAAKTAANAQQQSSDAQIALQREQLALAQSTAKPYQQAGTAADAILDARWNVSPATAAVNRAYGANPGGAFRPPSPYDAYSGPSAVYNAGTPAYSAMTSGGAVPQVRGPTRPQSPPAPQPETPWYANFTPQGLPPLPSAGPGQPQSPPAPPPAPPVYNPQGNAGGGYGGPRGAWGRMVRV